MKKSTKENIKLGVTFVVAAFLILYIMLQLIAPEMTVRVFGFRPYVVITDSMYPELKVNDLIIVTNFDSEDLNEEDIITFYADIDYNGSSEVVTHYIYSISEDDGTYYIQTHRYFDEDDEVTADPWVITGDDVLGQYAFHIPWIGAIVLFIQSPFGIAAMVVNIGVIVGIVILLKNGKAEEPTPEPESKD